jgi:uncharacterized membrane protein YtjA (UPF0391 family)
LLVEDTTQSGDQHLGITGENQGNCPRRAPKATKWIHAEADGPAKQGHRKTIPMLHYALVFLVVALIAGVLGFGFIAGTAAYIAKILFVVFLILFLISFISGRRGPIA